MLILPLRMSILKNHLKTNLIFLAAVKSQISGENSILALNLCVRKNPANFSAPIERELR